MLYPTCPSTSHPTSATMSNPSAVGASEGLAESTNTPPSMPAETKQQIANATQTGASGVHASGPDAGAATGAAPKVKTEKECKRPTLRACYKKIVAPLTPRPCSGKGAQEG